MKVFTLLGLNLKIFIIIIFKHIFNLSSRSKVRRFMQMQILILIVIIMKRRDEDEISFEIIKYKMK